jgi:DNA polymerase III subunit gamma/tau
MTQALYRKWRPRLWDQVVGQEPVVKTLQNAIRSQRVGHAYLFAGPRGTGKTTTARLLAKAVNCLANEQTNRPCDVCDNCKAVNENRFLDLIEIDAASNTSVEDVRDLRDKINFSPSQGKYKVYIIDEVHMLSTAAFNALLKTLEEPPPHAIFILATTEMHKIPATVLSRCQRHEFRRIPVADITRLLRELATIENIQADDDALTLIARQSTGSMRDAISLLDQLSSTGERVDLALTHTVLGTAALQAVVDLVDTLLEENTANGLQVVHRALDSGSDARQVARQTVDYLRNLLQVKVGNVEIVDATMENREKMTTQAQRFSIGRLVEFIRLFNSAAGETRSTWNPGLHLELALIGAIEAAKTPAQTVAKPVEPEVNIREIQMPDFHSSGRPANKPVVTTQAPVQPVKTLKPPTGTPEEKPTVQENPVETNNPAELLMAEKLVPANDIDVTLEDIQKAWPQIRTTVRKAKAQTEALLNSVKHITMQDGKLVLSFASDIVKQKMEMDDNMEMTRRAIFHVMKVDLKIICTVANARNSGIEKKDITREGVIDTAINLGGQIKKD